VDEEIDIEFEFDFEAKLGPLGSFLQRLALDKPLREEWNRDRARAIADSGLPAGDQQLLLSGDLAAIQRQIAKESGQAMVWICIWIR